MGNGQLQFPATQNPSSDVNTLDDYEEGTFTPTITAVTGSFTSVGSNTGKYTKIGNVVHVYVTMAITAIGTGADGYNIAGLPFANAASVNNPASCVNVSNSTSLTGYVQAGASTAIVIGTMVNTHTYNLQATYFVS